MTILLIRHGTTANLGRSLAGKLPNISLDENGRAEAERLAARLEGSGITAIYASSLERAIETAAPLSKRIEVPVIPEPDFGELEFGDWQGKNFAELNSIPEWKLFNEFRSGTAVPGGGIMVETQARFIRGLLNAAQENAGKTIAIFSHSDAIKSAIFYFLGIPIDFHARLEISPASITTLILFEDLVSLQSINVT